MAGLFDPSMFPNAMNSGAPQMGLLARLSQMINQPTGQSGAFPPQPGADAQASGLIPPQPQQAPQMPQGAPPMSPPQAQAPQGGGILDALTGFLGNHQNALMGLGAGIASGGLQRGVPGLAAGAQQDYTRNLQQSGMSGVYQSLIQAGVPEGVAKAAALNPELAKVVLPEYLGTPKVVQTGEDMFGNKKFMVQKGSQFSEIGANGQPTGGAPGSSTPSSNGPYLAPGVKQLDSSLVGDDYLNQFAPEVKAAVQDYIGGKSMPTGNPRAGFTQAIKMIAQKYGNDVGTPADDATFNARRTMRTQLSSAAPNSLGGQLNTGNTAIGHLADASQKALDLDNSNGWGFAPLAHAINTVRGLGTAQSAKMEALNDSIQHYGQEITKFYAGSPGGEAERQRFLTTAGAAKSPQELAAVFDTEAQLMQSRLGSLDSQIKGTLGPAGSAQYPVIRPESQQALGTIGQNVAKLRGLAPAGATSAKAPPAVGTVEQGHRFLGGDPSNPSSWAAVQ